MREIPIFAKSQYLENHMGRAQDHLDTDDTEGVRVFLFRRLPLDPSIQYLTFMGAYINNPLGSRSEQGRPEEPILRVDIKPLIRFHDDYWYVTTIEFLAMPVVH